MVACFLDLPAEIMCMILDQITEKDTFYKLLHCSRYCYELAVPYLYRDIELPFRVCPTGKRGTILHSFPERKGSLNGIEYFFPGAYSLICAILANSYLARLVKRFSIHTESSTTLIKDESIATADLDHNLQIAVRVAGKRSFVDGTSWLQDISELLNSDAVIAILVPSLPCLEQLRMDFTYDTPFRNRMADHAGRGLTYRQRAFQRLQRILSEWPARWYFYQATALLGLPLIILESWGYDLGLDGFSDLWPCPGNVYLARNVQRALSKITTIHLDESRCPLFTPNDIAFAVQSCRILKSLRLEWIQDLTTALAGNRRWQPSLDAILSQAPDTLEDLSLVYGTVHYPRETDALVRGPQTQILLPSLRVFSKLKTLKLCMAFIFGPGTIIYRDATPSFTEYLPYSHYLSSILPSSQETLHLVQHEFEMLAPLLMNIEAVVSIAQLDQHFRSLKDIVIESHCDPKQFTQEYRADHKTLFVTRENLGRYEDI